MQLIGILFVACVNFGVADALKEPEICYVLDAILFLYGIVLTVLYCRLKVQSRQQKPATPQVDYEKGDERIYTGLNINTTSPDTYETIGTHKPKM
ncbi:high affinity immunoglobulin epsilon receptor subunit gamma [Latimeria chalumnae]|uniref:high affinity immunoglobulin epsilon receptor subunit gamma n=1 Tax=Latimeria chalumnae TaxID=7897 RepID=UPI0003C1A835|nr:PREDICTED: high affinity immunoglobulin epsilon receptor subunit gamma [Latimeria chalumnae]|eukprot:XP_006004948.1 PREDICTED: high affinity immunoglobulin epsilon receptor subunit gamma [Latimeria chalumnae]